MRGKKLEKEVREYLKKNNIFFHKFTDSFASRGMVVPVPSDFIIWSKVGPSILLECKETKKSKIPLTNFRPSQFLAMRNSIGKESVHYYVLVNYDKRYYLIGAEEVLKCLDNEKSIDLEDDIIPGSNLKEIMEYMLEDNYLQS